MTFKYARDIISDRFSLYSSSTSVAGTVRPLSKNSNKPIVPTSPLNSDSSILECSPLETDGKGNFVTSSDGRKFTLKGINVDSAMKLPATPHMPSYTGNSTEHDNIFFDGDNVSFVGRPFPLDEAASHFQRIKSWGYNNVRYLITWEALEHKGPGIYDEKFIDYTIEILKIIHQVGGLYVYLELHQDVWSRFSGGSGAPMWTLYAAGFEPRRFTKTEAAIFHNETRYQDESEAYQKMLWVSNYKRLAAETMFTMFFSGKNFFPNLQINGVNIQEYLQSHYFNATGHLWERVNQELPHLVENGTIMGFESMNEPNMGLFGLESIDSIPACQQLRVGTTPTAFETMKLGMGLACEVDEYRISIVGPQKSGTRIIDPAGARAWLSSEEAVNIDKKYGWKRAASWKLGECIYADAGIWSWGEELQQDTIASLSPQERLKFSQSKAQILDGGYFSSAKHGFNTKKKINSEYFINHNFIDFYLRFKELIRKISPNVFVFMQPPVLEIPPRVKTDPRLIIDSKTVYCPHYYDGMSLMFKTWNTKFNVDTLGIMRGKYLNPVLGIVFGERAIRNCIKKQFHDIRGECEEYLGSIPCLMSETGMPFDMDGKRSYANGKYISQTGALDALSFALEGSNMSHSYWCYTSVNCHKWGDRWNNEDFSFWSPEDRNLQYDDNTGSQSSSRRGSIRSSIMAVRSRLPNEAGSMIRARINRLSLIARPQSGNAESIRSHSNEEESLDVRPNTSNNTNETTNDISKAAESEDEDTSSLPESSLLSSSGDQKCMKNCYPSTDGVRAASAVIRPFAIATMGQILEAEFDLKNVKFTLTLRLESKSESSLTNTPSVIFVPKWHYPFLNYSDISLTSGYVRYNERLEYLEWFHAEEPDFSTTKEDSISPMATSAVTGTVLPTPPVAMRDKTASSSVSSASRIETIVIHNQNSSIEFAMESTPNLSDCKLT